jgi:quercetin dioxygenase-like cupin family protein
MKGIKNIQHGETYEVRDVWSYDVTVSKDKVKYLGDDFVGTSYLMGKGCDIDVKNGYTVHRGDFAGQIGKGFLVCGDSFAHIKFYGLSMNDERLFLPQGNPKGNLSYMDGGTNTTAVNPGRLGLPVINYVHFPAGMSQTLHTHPSQRIGLILSGSGEIELDDGVMFPIKAGDCWVMDRNVLHNFMCNKGEDVTLFVFSPDSGTGPTDEINPLKVRTYVGQTRV